MLSENPQNVPPKANLRNWWNSFTFAQKAKKEAEARKGGPSNIIMLSCRTANMVTRTGEVVHTVFGKPLRESLKYASVQISTANANGELYVWGYIPVVVAKCGLYLKENATEVEGTFRVNGSSKRMRELQAEFEKPPRYGKSLDWKKENYNTHDVASVFRRYLTQMPEPVIPYDMYHGFREALAKRPYNQDEVIATYKSLIRSMPRANQYLLLYVLDLLSVFARKSDKNLMTATNLAVIFRPGLISHPNHEMSPQEHQLSQNVLEFLIAHQDWFMLDIPPPPSSSATGTLRDGVSDPDDIHVVPSSDEDQSLAGIGTWKLAGLKRKVSRRRTLENSDSLAKEVSQMVKDDSVLHSVAENSPSSETVIGGATGVVRSKTMPSRAGKKGDAGTGAGHAKLVRKQKRDPSQPKRAVEVPV